MPEILAPGSRTELPSLSISDDHDWAATKRDDYVLLGDHGSKPSKLNEVEDELDDKSLTVLSVKSVLDSQDYDVNELPKSCSSNFLDCGLG